MNRAERRRNKIKTHEAMISVKRSDIAQIKKQATEEAMRIAIILLNEMSLEDFKRLIYERCGISF